MFSNRDSKTKTLTESAFEKQSDVTLHVEKGRIIYVLTVTYIWLKSIKKSKLFKYQYYNLFIKFDLLHFHILVTKNKSWFLFSTKTYRVSLNEIETVKLSSPNWL